MYTVYRLQEKIKYIYNIKINFFYYEAVIRGKIKVQIICIYIERERKGEK